MVGISSIILLVVNTRNIIIFFYVTSSDSDSAYWTGPWLYQSVFYADLSLALLQTLIAAGFWLATPAFHDAFKIRNEMRYSIIALVAIPSIEWVWYPIYSDLTPTLAECVVMGIFFVTVFLLAMSTVGYTVIKGRSLGYLPKTINNSRLLTENEGLVDGAVPMPSPPSSPGINKNPLKIRLQHILGQRKMLDLFAQHLVSEFSIECLLAVIEFGQFKIMLKNDTEFMERLKIEQEKKKR